ncbi:MAG: hypothetical protein LBG65_08260 [Puniceicoccales bacterium]|jgi:XTP/dITP diphosphohydrolase|nr:hypothetical protein [Puniceicoccales bacterium]
MRIYLATGNGHKVTEFNRMLRGDAAAAPVAHFLGAGDVGGMPPVAEDTGSFEGNARQKALALRARVPAGAWVLADDSGLCCDALGGAPGVETANYAGPSAPSALNRRKLLDALHGTPAGRRGAHFSCVLLLIAPDGAEFWFRGKCPGVILEAEQGDGGFGYDSIFCAEGTTCSFAQLSPAEKDERSHRGRAFRAFLGWLAGRQEKLPISGI